MQFITELCSLQGKKLILASRSPRRIELLRHIGLQFEVFPSEAEEAPSSYHNAPEYARHLAQSKAAWVSRRMAADLIIAADTIVVKEGSIFEKPADQAQALRMLRALSGATHQVITAICLRSARREIVAHELTEVTFYPLNEHEINIYLTSGESVDKAGGYAIQGLGAVFIRKIEGCYFNVMGFPLARFYQCLKEFNL